MLKDKKTPPKGFYKRCAKGYLWDYEYEDPYAHYLTRNELCDKSGLSNEQLAQIEKARLLLPDRPDGRYRPKLVNWGKKISYLLGKGWEIEEIRHWSKERWKMNNPKEWPPKLEEWR